MLLIVLVGGVIASCLSALHAYKFVSLGAASDVGIAVFFALVTLEDFILGGVFIIQRELSNTKRDLNNIGGDVSSIRIDLHKKA